ncbi:MAG TPA: FtsW/RodA/SpoVE family cell cycle protein [Bacteroidales bacterium]
MELLQKIFKGDRIVWIVYAILCVISLIEVFSATSTLAYSTQNPFGPIARHASFLIMGTVGVIFLHNFHYKYTKVVGVFVLFLAVTLLILTPLIGVRVNNASRWIELFGVQFQPSEFAKLAMVIFTAFVLSKCQRTEEALTKAFWIILIFTAGFAALILAENLSTALMLCVVVFIMLFFGRVPIKKLLLVAGIVLFFVVVFLLLLKYVDSMPGMKRWETWQNRIFGQNIGVMDAGFKIDDSNYQTSHANIAIANGTFIGSLPGNSTQRDFLPQAYSDFIYAIIIEETGWLGAIAVPFLYMVLLYRALKIARKCTKVFPMLLVMGSSLIVSFQAIVNMMVAVGAGPVTGQPMPLVSRGGTSTLITCIYFGIILSVSRYGVPNTEMEGDSDDDIDEVKEKAFKTSQEYGV